MKNLSNWKSVLWKVGFVLGILSMVILESYRCDLDRNTVIARHMATLTLNGTHVSLQGKQVHQATVKFSHEENDYLLRMSSNDSMIIARLGLMQVNSADLLIVGEYQLRLPIGIWYNPFDGTYDLDHYTFLPVEDKIAGLELVIGTRPE